MKLLGKRAKTVPKVQTDTHDRCLVEPHRLRWAPYTSNPFCSQRTSMVKQWNLFSGWIVS